MLRELCFCVVFLNSFHYDRKFNSVCMAYSDKSKGIFTSVLGTLQKYVGEVKKFFNRSPERSNMQGLPHEHANLVKFYEHFNLPKSAQDSDMSEFDIDRNHGRNKARYTFPENAYAEKITTKKPRVILPVKVDMNATELIASLGFRSETHSVVTTDGYILTLHRIMSETERPPSAAVILHHGILGSSDDWLLLGPGLALPYLLVDKGYDVWLLNARGNKYSRRHSTLYSESYEFWDFTWHEMGIYDLPASITYISEHTDDADLYFIGHSMGASTLLALLSTIPEYNDVLKSAFLLAPLSFMYHAKGPLKQLAKIRKRKGITALNFIGTNAFMPSGSFPSHIIEKYCKGSEQSCLNPLLLMANGGELLDEDLMNNVLTHVPAGGSAMTILHYIQLVKSGRFQMYDFGVQDNYKKYKRKYAPEYDLSSISLPISLFSSPSDWLSSDSDVSTLISKLNNVYSHKVVKRTDFSHMDFVWAKDAPEQIFSVMLDILEQIAPMKNIKNSIDTLEIKIDSTIPTTTEED